MPFINGRSVKNFSTCFAVAELVLWSALVIQGPAGAAKPSSAAPEELTNFRLSPGYSQWLVGPIARMASQEEIGRFLALHSDVEAQEFIERFWEQRGGEAIFPARGQKLIFQERAEEADRLYSEGTHRGSRTDRGTIYVLYGPPEKIDYESPVRQHGEPIEVWNYPKDRDEGLDGQKSDRTYRFVKQGDRTVFYRGPIRRQPSRAARDWPPD